jgi:hypothetical protein
VFAAITAAKFDALKYRSRNVHFGLYSLCVLKKGVPTRWNVHGCEGGMKMMDTQRQMREWEEMKGDTGPSSFSVHLWGFLTAT